MCDKYYISTKQINKHLTSTNKKCQTFPLYYVSKLQHITYNKIIESYSNNIKLDEFHIYIINKNYNAQIFNEIITSDEIYKIIKEMKDKFCVFHLISETQHNSNLFRHHTEMPKTKSDYIIIHLDKTKFLEFSEFPEFKDHTLYINIPFFGSMTHKEHEQKREQDHIDEHKNLPLLNMIQVCKLMSQNNKFDELKSVALSILHKVQLTNKYANVLYKYNIQILHLILSYFFKNKKFKNLQTDVQKESCFYNLKNYIENLNIQHIFTYNCTLNMIQTMLLHYSI